MLNNEWLEVYYTRKLEKGASLESLKTELEAKRRIEEEAFWKKVNQRLNNARTASNLSA